MREEELEFVAQPYLFKRREASKLAQFEYGCLAEASYFTS